MSHGALLQVRCKLKYILGVDIGTTAIKAALFDENGKLAGSNTREYTLQTPFPQAVELDVEVYKTAFFDAIQGAVKESGVSKQEIVSLGISAQGETFVCLDENNKALRPAIVWLDNRAQDESDELAKVFDNKTIHRVTGQVEMCATWPATKILWIKKHEPDIFNKVKKYLLIEDYFIYLMTGEMVSEDSLLCSTILWDINTREYWPEMLQYLGVSEEQLPKVCHQGEQVGKLHKEGADYLNLQEGMTIALGALDQACGAIGVGNVRPGIFSESTGAALATVAIVDSVAIDPNGVMPCFAGGIPGTYMIHSFSTGGMALRWFRDVFCAAEMEIENLGGPNGYYLIDKMAEKIPAGSDGMRVLPHLQGAGAPDTNSQASAVFYGVSLQHNKAHFARAIMEAIVMVLRRMIEATEAMGVDINEIRSISGGAKSPFWCQMKSDATGVMVKTMKNTESAACLGAAILAGVACGIWEDVAETAERFTTPEHEYMPATDKKDTYDKLLADYKKLFAAYEDIFKTIN